MRLIIRISVISMVILISCSRPESVKFKKIINAKVHSISGKDIVVHADALLYNPNNIKGKVREVVIDVEMDGEKVAEIKREDSLIEVMKNNQFTVPLELIISLKPLKKDLLDRLVKITTTRKLSLHYTGYFRIKVYGFNYKIPVDYNHELEIR